ncbi:MAG: hypothetical protein GKR89_13605 [Candidatus Latescibacteria bacterium]|nr:hypothetical protein [Candidatus Latescibacterota bacterium]
MKLSSLGIWFCVLLALPRPGSGHVGGEPVPVLEFAPDQVPDVHDGSLADWERAWGGLEPAYTKSDARPLNTAADFGLHPLDLEFNWYFGWSAAANRLYFAAQVFDDIYLRPEGLDIESHAFFYDSLELMVDGDHSGGWYSGFTARSYPGEVSPAEDSLMTNLQAQHYSLFPPWPRPAGIAAYSHGAGWVDRPPYAEVGGGVVPGAAAAGSLAKRTQYLVEGYVTVWDSLVWHSPDESRPSQLAPGRIVGVQISVSDCDTQPGNCHGYFTLAGAQNAWRHAFQFVDVELVASPRPSAVQDDSWARIKASFK